MKRLFLALSTAVLGAGAAVTGASAQDGAGNTAPALGRLFFSAAERAKLEQDRGRLPDRPNPETPRSIGVTGLITRPGAPALPVINGKVVFPGDNPSGLRISGRADGRVLITPPDGPGRTAKPGQYLDLETGEIRERFELPGRRDARLPQPSLHTPYVTGTLQKVEAAPAPQVKKARRPRRGIARRSAAPPPRPPAEAPAPQAPRVAPPNAAAPAIPAPLPRQP